MLTENSHGIPGQAPSSRYVSILFYPGDVLSKTVQYEKQGSFSESRYSVYERTVRRKNRATGKISRGNIHYRNVIGRSEKKQNRIISV